jgi:murein DD-endopeptidase MepM/ murein hydrolase activator NlpD
MNGAAPSARLKRQDAIHTISVMEPVARRMGRAGARLAAVLLLAALSACARYGGPAPVVRGEEGPVASLPPAGAPTGEAPAEDGRFITVRQGDTLYSIARRHGVSLRALIDRNRIEAPFLIERGQRLILPTPQVYKVERGDTVYGIARRFRVEMRELVRINDIRPPYVISTGQSLRLPGAETREVRETRAEPQARGVVSAARDAFEALTAPLPRAASQPPAGEAAPAPVVRRSGPTKIEPPPPREGGKFLWPVRGKILARFGSRGGGLHNDGINISAAEGTVIRAAEAGVVAYAGNELQGFGNLLLIKHADGWMSAYAHGKELLVNRGDIVKRGQAIARVGRTGSVSSPQLHFELRRGDRAVDPMPYMIRMAGAGGDGGRFSSASFRAARPDPG